MKIYVVEEGRTRYRCRIVRLDLLFAPPSLTSTGIPGSPGAPPTEAFQKPSHNLLYMLPRLLRLIRSRETPPTTFIHRFHTMPSTNYAKILTGKYPAKLHASKVVDQLRRADPSITDGVIYLEAMKEVMHEDCDQATEFRQRRPFHYLSGLTIPNAALTYRIGTETLTLYIPPIDPEEVLWSGLPLSPEEAKQQSDVDDVRFTGADLDSDLTALQQENIRLFTLPEQNFNFTAALQHPASSPLRKAIDTARTTKTPYELALIWRANAISADAHRAVIRAAKTAKTEAELHAIFAQTCIAAGAPTQAYTGIFGAGEHAATLHYIKNNAPTVGKGLMLVDAGCELRTYASDITRCFPLTSDGKFSELGRGLYEVVLRMQKECMAIVKPGVRWEDVHMLAHRVAIEGLIELGVFRKEFKVEEILEQRTSCAFFPHGLGHFLGMDTHDVGGNPNYADPDVAFRYLRKRGELEVGNVITVEPGVYFCRYIVEPFLKDEKHAKYIDQEVLEKFWEVGGVRIEGKFYPSDGDGGWSWG